ncbi:DUF2442 domain-containing protein [Blastochloris viridis]|uniref:DUF2442 domain-containing protein n=1 Tax=Blastochloris viridis TaxID=1079 RepID=A0A0H5BBM5_BLAVI|nr:DUF2442 domain-containing protein [Blastochloris viridis]ALK10407.1 hypothetical protein BVIR_2642 [Blastochloris viridis]BAR99652.1 hypothetical protein BV133_2059 [Blastochloris viridis]CUU43069.1 hypothetical protein BVIRIDIS_20860 [Blastochloris viridis]
MTYSIRSVEVVRYPVLRVTFDDGFSGDYDLGDHIESGPVFAPLKDPKVFGEVAVAPGGRTFGWFLDREGHELDFCPDSTRIRLETEFVERLAEQHRSKRPAAE